jgi:hypothetical protein
VISENERSAKRPVRQGVEEDPAKPIKITTSREKLDRLRWPVTGGVAHHGAAGFGTPSDRLVCRGHVPPQALHDPPGDVRLV